MLRFRISLAALLAACPACVAAPAQRPTTYDEIIAKQAKAHGVPESFVHRTVMRESRYNPHLVHRHCYGLMQIKQATARSMGYKGNPAGLLDAETNLTYAIPYLANAYMLAGGDEDKATALYRRGYYFFAKRNGMLASLQTASSPTPASDPGSLAPSEARPADPVTAFFSFLAGTAPGAPPSPADPRENAAPAAPAASSARDVLHQPAGIGPASASLASNDSQP